MEVHHHPDLHHKKKRWKEYFLEFLMIFLAVSMGFLAESYRESQLERAKEKEYIRSMIEDAQTDTANIRQAILINNRRIRNLDTLAKECFKYGESGNNDSIIYRLFRRGLRHPDIVSPTERTLTQLKNSGGMRMIQNKIAVDSIILYDDFAKKLTDQQMYYERYLNAMVDQSMLLINYNYFPFDTIPLSANQNLVSYKEAKLMNPDKTKVMELGNRASIYKGVVTFYIVRLHEGNDHAVNLIRTLREEYHIE